MSHTEPPSNEKKGVFLRKDDNGNDLFYPWGYPGEAFYIDEKQKSFIRFGFIILLTLISISLIAIVFSEIFGWLIDNVFLFDIFNLYYFSLPTYVFLTWLIVRNKKAYTEDNQKERQQKWGLIALWGFILFPFSVVYTTLLTVSFFAPEHGRHLYSVSRESDGALLLLAHFVSTVILMYVFFKLVRTKGYFFSKL